MNLEHLCRGIPLKVLVSAIAGLAAISAAYAKTSPDILGEWRGTSLCTNLSLAPACKDEEVRYVFTDLGGGKIHLVADKLVNKAYALMGEMDLAAAENEWRYDFEIPACSCRWRFWLSEGGLAGELDDRKAGAVLRKVAARRYTAP